MKYVLVFTQLDSYALAVPSKPKESSLAQWSGKFRIRSIFLAMLVEESFTQCSQAALLTQRQIAEWRCSSNGDRLGGFQTW